MRIEKSNKSLVEKALRTLEKMLHYKKLLLKYQKAILGKSDISVVKRIRTEFIVHFTDRTKATSIICDRAIKIINKEGYSAFTELSFYDMGVLASRDRPYGFAFLKDDIANKFSLYSPLFYNKRATELLFRQKDLHPSLKDKLLVDPSPRGQESINFSVFSEIRTLEEIPLKHCCLFFRNDRIDDDTSIAKSLNDLAIFRLPYAPGWLSEFVSGGQKWIIREDESYLEFYDQRSTMTETGKMTEIGDKTIDQVILRLKSVGGMK